MTDKEIKIKKISDQSGMVYCEFPEAPGLVVFKEFQQEDQIPNSVSAVREQADVVGEFIQHRGVANISQGFSNGWVS